MTDFSGHFYWFLLLSCFIHLRCGFCQIYGGYFDDFAFHLLYCRFMRALIKPIRFYLLNNRRTVQDSVQVRLTSCSIGSGLFFAVE